MTSALDTSSRLTSDDEPLAALIDEFLRAAERDGAFDGAGNRYSPAAVRSLRRALLLVRATLGAMPVHLAALDRDSIADMAWRTIEERALAPSRFDSLADAMHSLVAYAACQRPAVQTPSRAGALPRIALEPPAESAPRPHSQPASITPTSTMLLLGARAGRWIERVIVLALVLTAIGLALALA
jgi:hypothetical protein